MKQELEDKLFKKYPKMFPKGRDVNMKENLMCFGFSHGDGWFNILDELFTEIDKLLINENEINMVQVKEKFGSLRVYYDIIKGEDTLYNDINNLIDKAESKSEITCEVCGKPGECRNRIGWVSTVCDEHVVK